MSDPAKAPEEIEDVLASVRRLVADNTHKRARVAPTADAQSVPSPISASEQAEALVLSQAYRVTDPEDPWVPVAMAQEAVDHEAAWQPDDKLVHYDAVGDAEEPTPASPEWSEGDGNEVSQDDIEDLIRLDGATGADAGFEPETGDDNWPRAGAEAALMARVAAHEPASDAGAGHGADADAQGAMEDAIEGDVPPEDNTADADAAPLGNADFPDPLEASSDVAETPAALDGTAEEHENAAGERAEERAEDEGDVLDLADDDTAKGAEQAATGAGDDALDAADPAQASPDDDAESETASRATPIFSRQTGQVNDSEIEPTQGTAETPDDTPSPYTDPDADPEAEAEILDEDTLREIIVGVVREELQGVLGQRITRNLRKMVRREIQRALGADDPD